MKVVIGKKPIKTKFKKKFVVTCDMCQRVKSLNYKMDGEFQFIRSSRLSLAKYLPVIEKYFNITPHDTAGFSPYEMHFGIIQVY